MSELPEGVYRYVIFLNPERTRMRTCWPQVDGASWKVDRAERAGPWDTWGPPETAGISGDLESITRHFALEGLTVRELVA